jgi:two-component system, sensor histidine kinase and response regulator
MSRAITLDIDRALRRLGGDRELVAKLIEFIAEDLPPLIEQIETSLRAGRYSEIERAAHSIKGLVSNVYCEAILEQALKIEQSARACDREAIALEIPLLRDLIRKFLLLLRDVHSELAALDDR